MNYEQEFLKDFEEWINTQIIVNQGAVKASQQVWEEEQDERARDAVLRYEAKLDAYTFLQGKFANYQAGKKFHDFPDDLLGKRDY
ncbi:DUF1912 family protein [Streptococcus dentiloxodontae]